MLSQRLVFLRKKKKKTQQEVADFLGISRPAYTAYERGNREPDYEILKNIASYFEVSTDYLLGHSDTPSLTNEEEFHAFLNNPDLELWYKELPENDEEDLEALKQMWEIIKKNKK